MNTKSHEYNNLKYKMMSKKIISYFTATYLILTCFSSAYGQWDVNGGLPNRYYETRNFPALFNIRSVGVGNFFSNGFEPMSALHVNTNFLDLSPNFPKGDVFMTTGPANEDNSWRMFTGAGNGIERFSITVPANSNNAVLQTQQANSRMLFNTNGAINRMLIMDGGTGSTDGRIAMGNNLPPLFIPQARLHLYQDAPSAIYTKYTAGNTGTNLTDGFDVGYDATSGIQNRQYAVLNNRENTAMKFWTNNLERLSIAASGEVIINKLACANCLVMTKENGELYTDNQTILNLENKIKYLEQKLLMIEKLMAKNE